MLMIVIIEAQEILRDEVVNGVLFWWLIQSLMMNTHGWLHKASVKDSIGIQKVVSAGIQT